MAICTCTLAGAVLRAVQHTLAGLWGLHTCVSKCTAALCLSVVVVNVLHQVIIQL